MTKIIKGFQQFVNENIERAEQDELGSMGFPTDREWAVSMPIDFDYLLQDTAAEVKSVFMNWAPEVDSIQIDMDSVELDEWSDRDIYLNGEDESDGIDYGFSASIHFRFKTALTDESEIEYILTNAFPKNVFMGVEDLTKLAGDMDRADRADQDELGSMGFATHGGDYSDLIRSIKKEIENYLPKWNTTLYMNQDGDETIRVENPADSTDYYTIMHGDWNMLAITKGDDGAEGNTPAKMVNEDPRAVARELAKMVSRSN